MKEDIQKQVNICPMFCSSDFLVMTSTRDHNKPPTRACVILSDKALKSSLFAFFNPMSPHTETKTIELTRRICINSHVLKF